MANDQITVSGTDPVSSFSFEETVTMPQAGGTSDYSTGQLRALVEQLMERIGQLQARIDKINC
jgi:hypothetical protein